MTVLLSLTGQASSASDGADLGPEGSAAAGFDPAHRVPDVSQDVVFRPTLPELRSLDFGGEDPDGGQDDGVHKIAVVVGINDYGNWWMNLGEAVNDARTVTDALSRLGFDAIMLLVNDQATSGHIRYGLQWLAQQSTPGSLGVFFFAGHAYHQGGDPDLDGEDVDEAIMGSDEGTLWDRDIANLLAQAQGELWLAIAACYAQGFNDAIVPGRTIGSWAASENELAYESPQLENSFLVEFLVERAVMYRGLKTVEALHRFARNNMRGQYRRYRPLLQDQIFGNVDLSDESGQRERRHKKKKKKDEPQSCPLIVWPPGCPN